MTLWCRTGVLQKTGSRASAHAWIFDRAADDHVVVAVAPIVRQALRQALNPLGEKKKLQIGPFAHHAPAISAPSVRLFQQKIGGKANVDQLAALHPVFAVFLFHDGSVKLLVQPDDLVRILPAFCVALMNIAKAAAFAEAMASPPWIPYRHFTVPSAFRSLSPSVRAIRRA